MKPLPRSKAFSLLELLVVIAILGIMAVAGAAALGGSGGKSLQNAASVASSFFSVARSEAILRRVPVRVVVDADSSRPGSESYLRRMAVIYSTNGGTTWDVASRWTTLPANAKFNADLSTVTNATMSYSGLSGAQGSQRFYYYEFQPNGQIPSSPQFVVSPLAGGTNQLYGFKVFRMGKLAFLNDPSAIRAQ